MSTFFEKSVPIYAFQTGPHPWVPIASNIYGNEKPKPEKTHLTFTIGVPGMMISSEVITTTTSHS